MHKKYKLKEVSSIVSGSTAPKDHFFNNDNGTPFIRAGHLKELIENDCPQLLPKLMKDLEGQLKLKIVPKKTILFAKSGMSSTKNRIYKCSQESYIVNHLVGIIPNEDLILSDYLMYFLILFKPSRLIIDESYPSIRLQDIQEIEIDVPDISVQKKIIDTLNKSRNLIVKRQSQITALDELTQSMFLEMFGDPVTNNKKWPVKKLGELGVLNRGISKHRPRNAPELLGGPYPLIQTGDVANSGLFIKDYKSTYSEIGLQQSKMWESGTLCITIAANIAKTGILKFDACFPDSVVGYTSGDSTNNIFIHYWFGFFQKILEKNAPESAQKNINLKILNNMDVIVPPLELQDKFKDFVLQIEKQKDILNNSFYIINDLYQSLLLKAFKGELFEEKVVELTH